MATRYNPRITRLVLIHDSSHRTGYTYMFVFLMIPPLCVMIFHARTPVVGVVSALIFSCTIAACPIYGEAV